MVYWSTSVSPGMIEIITRTGFALWRASPTVQQWSTATPLYPGGSRRTLADPFTWPDLA